MPALFKGRLSIPVIGAPLFIISVPDLVIAQCKAGVVGSFPALNARPAELLDEWLHRIKEELAAYDKAHPERPSAPFAVNQIVHKSNNRLDQDLALCDNLTAAANVFLGRELRFGFGPVRILDHATMYRRASMSSLSHSIT